MTMWLIGMMGAGKTSSGSIAAANLEITFYDSDAEVAKITGMPVAKLWGESGESSFREVERNVVERLAGEPAIVATGGGAVVDPANRERMSATGRVVWLDASPHELLARLGDGVGRPLLEPASDPLQELTRLLAQRLELYRSLADVVIDTSGRTVDEVAAEIGALWAR